MTRVNFKLDDAGAARYQQLVDLRAQRVTQAMPAFEAIADDIEDLEEVVFSTQGRLYGGRGWKPDSKMWERYKERRGLSNRVLEMARPGEVGRLRRSLTEKGAPYGVRRVTNEEAERGTRLGIARIHQTGGTVTLRRGKSGKTQQVKIPRRRFVQSRRADRERWLSYLEDQLRTGKVRSRRVT